MVNRNRRPGRARALLGIAMVVAVASLLVIGGSTAASAAPVHWFSCKSTKGGEYGFGCQNVVANGGWEKTKVVSGTSLKLRGETEKGEKIPFYFYWNFGGLEIEAKCSTSTGSGTLTNPLEGSAGVENMSYSGTSCTVPKPAGQGCKIKGGTIPLNPLHGSFNPEGAAELAAAEVISVFTIEGCSTSGLNGVKKVTGTLPAKFNSTNSVLEIPKILGAGSPLNLGGQPVSFASSPEMLTSVGERLLLAP